MARASYEGLKRLQAPKRPFLVSRSGFSGIQRYAWVWTGDNVASFAHLALAHRMFLGMGLSGIPFAGADIGGFVPEEWPELTVRWYQASALTPLFRKGLWANDCVHRVRIRPDQGGAGGPYRRFVSLFGPIGINTGAIAYR